MLVAGPYDDLSGLIPPQHGCSPAWFALRRLPPQAVSCCPHSH